MPGYDYAREQLQTALTELAGEIEDAEERWKEVQKDMDNWSSYLKMLHQRKDDLQAALMALQKAESTAI